MFSLGSSNITSSLIIIFWNSSCIIFLFLWLSYFLYSHQVLISLSFLFSLFYRGTQALSSAPRLLSFFLCLMFCLFISQDTISLWQLSTSTVRVWIFFVLVCFNSVHPIPAKIWYCSWSLFSLLEVILFSDNLCFFSWWENQTSSEHISELKERCQAVNFFLDSSPYFSLILLDLLIFWWWPTSDWPILTVPLGDTFSSPLSSPFNT